MKRFYGLFVIVFTTFLFSCSKDKLNNKLIGTWELTEAYYGWGGPKHYQSGNGNTVTFRTDNHYLQTVANTDSSYNLTYNYQLVNADECGTNLILKSATNSDVNRSRVSVSNDTLFIDAGSCIADGNSFFYVRK